MFILFLCFAVLGFFFPPLWILAAIFLAASLINDVTSMAKAGSKTTASLIELARTKECPHCRTRIDKRATTCPHCQKDQPT